MYGAQSPDTRPHAAPRPGVTYGHSSQAGVRRLGAGVALALALLILGFLAKTGPITSIDTGISKLAAHTRNALFTPLAEFLTLIMTPEAWAVLAVIGAVVLFLLRMRGQALRVFCVMIGSTAVVFVSKALVDEHRPPKSLWVIKASADGSFPSGHTMAAAAIAVCAVILVPVAARRAVTIAGAVLVVVVALARVYLGVHYLLDTLGSVLAVACATVFLSGLALLPPGRRWLLALDSASRGGTGVLPAIRQPDSGPPARRDQRDDRPSYGGGFFDDEPDPGDARPGGAPQRGSYPDDAPRDGDAYRGNGAGPDDRAYRSDRAYPDDGVRRTDGAHRGDGSRPNDGDRRDGRGRHDDVGHRGDGAYRGGSTPRGDAADRGEAYRADGEYRDGYQRDGYRDGAEYRGRAGQYGGDGRRGDNRYARGQRPSEEYRGQQPGGGHRSADGYGAHQQEPGPVRGGHRSNGNHSADGPGRHHEPR